MKEIWHIIDRAFAHTNSCNTNFYKPTYFNWNRDISLAKSVFITDHDIHTTPYINNDIKKIAFLCESPFITRTSHDFVLQNSNMFDYILTHNKILLKSCKNALFYPLGGTYLSEVQTSLCISESKNKLISMMFSNKQYAPGHIMRHKIYEKLKNVIDCMGSGISGNNTEKYLSYKNYMFSVVVENVKEDFYFSEKINECFLTKTIPIYWGCPSINKFFNTEGFITFNSIEELETILQNKDFLLNFYTSKQNVIEENFKIAQKFKIAEDFIFLNYKKLIKDK